MEDKSTSGLLIGLFPFGSEQGRGGQLIKTFNFSALQMKMSFFQHKILIDDGFQILQWKYCNADLRESQKRFLQQSKSDDVDNAMVLIRFSL